MIVRLTWREVHTAARVGIRQVIGARARGMSHRTGEQDFRWEGQIDGYIGEHAVCNALGIPFDPDLRNFTKRPDVAGYEVRTTTRRDGGLRIYIEDADEREFLLVVLLLPGDRRGLPCDVVGWQYAHRGKLLGKWTKLGNQYVFYLDRCHLHPFDRDRRR